jgi:hypothetical protein
MVGLVMPRLTKGPTDRPDLNHRATSLLYLAANSSFVTAYLHTACVRPGE